MPATWSSIRSWGPEPRWPRRTLLERVGYGAEISPAYCDVILRRMINLTGRRADARSDAETFAAVAEARGVPVDQALNPKAQDSRAIKHHGPNPFYGNAKLRSSTPRSLLLERPG